MSIESDLIDRLVGIVGDRVYPYQAPPGTATPYAVYEVQDGEQTYVFAGPTNLETKHIEVTVWDKVYQDAVSSLATVIAEVTDDGIDFVCAALAHGTGFYDKTTALYGVSALFHLWAPGVGVVTYTLLTAQDGTTVLTAQDGTTVLNL